MIKRLAFGILLPAAIATSGMGMAQDWVDIEGILQPPTTALSVQADGGIWKIDSSEPAPWPHDASWEVPSEVKRLVGTRVFFKADRIEGPAPLACKGAHYEIKQYAADMLFQGTLAEKGDPKTTPEKTAAALGFGKSPIPTLVTGCASEIEFHVMNYDHMLFGLNNRVYRMVRNYRFAARAKAKP